MSREQILKFRYSCARCDSVQDVEFPNADAADDYMVDLGWRPVLGHGHGVTWECSRHRYVAGPQ